jgi:hypothetical protein
MYTFTLGMDNCLVIDLYIFTKCKNNGRTVWRYQSGNQNPYIEEEQTTQWPKEKVLKDKQWSTKQTHKTKDQVTRTPLKTGSELRCSGRVSSSCSTSGTRHVNLRYLGITPERKKWQQPQIKIDLLLWSLTLYLHFNDISMIFLLEIGTVPTLWYIFCFLLYWLWGNKLLRGHQMHNVQTDVRTCAKFNAPDA